MGGPTPNAAKPDARTGKVYTTVTFGTRTLPCLNELYDLFYSVG